MSVVGLGTDIVEIDRLSGDNKRVRKLAERVLTDNELATFESQKQPERFLAKRFAAKEAAVKALGTGIGNGISWHQIEISSDQLGAPLLNFSGTAKIHADSLGAQRYHLSIADEQHYAVATVILSAN